MDGPTQSSQDTSFVLTVQLAGAALGIGTYYTFKIGTAFDLGKNTGNNEQIYRASYLNTSQVITIQITRYDEATKTVSAIFSGYSSDVNDNQVPITNGVFKAIVQII